MDLRPVPSKSSSATEVDPRPEWEIDEFRTEQYGGDDPRDPPSRQPGPYLPPQKEEVLDYDKVTWDGPDDPENPQSWSLARKWGITVICLLMTVNVTFASSAPSFAGTNIAAHFHKPKETAYLVTSVFLCGYIFGPFIWGPGSELLGRKPMFIVALSAYTLLHLGQALAHNIETLLVTRFLGGFFAVAPLTNCGGVIVDIWDPVNRGHATSMFVAGVFTGPVLGPIVGGFLTSSYLGWRWVFWIMMIFAGTCTVIMIFFLPETYAPVILQRKARRLRKADPVANKDKFAEHEKSDWSVRGVLHRTLYRPIIMLVMEPILVLVTLYTAFIYGILYSLFEAMPVIFMGKHGFTIGECGLIFIGVGIGTTFGAATFWFLSRHHDALIPKWHGFPPPEGRLTGAMIGAPTLIIGCFWLGWTGAYASVSWVAPAFATIFIGYGVSLVFVSFISYLVDTYLLYAASALSANTLVRSAIAAGFPLFTVQMYDNLGINWACTLLGLILVVLLPSPFLFYKYGATIRKRSRFSPSPDLRIAELLEAEAIGAAADDEEPEKKV
ncbi:MFS polyamine transporter [Sparassis latifolia]